MTLWLIASRAGSRHGILSISSMWGNSLLSGKEVPLVARETQSQRERQTDDRDRHRHRHRHKVSGFSTDHHLMQYFAGEIRFFPQDITFH